MKKLISLFLSACLLLMVFDFNVLAFEDGDQPEETTIAEETTEEESEPLVVEETEPEVIVEETEPESEPVPAWDGVTTSDVFENDSIRATFSLDNHWNGGYVATVTIENISDRPVGNWAFVFEYAGNINSIWNATIDETVENGYVLRNVGWNQDIQPGSSISFGLSGVEDFQGFPTNYTLLGKVSEVSSDGYTSGYTLYSDWGSGFNAEMSLTNTSDTTIEDWIVEFDFDRTITEIWKAEIISHEGSHYVIKNLGYDANIESGATVTFGFNGTDGEADFVPYNVVLSSSTLEPTIEEFDNSEELVSKVFGDLDVIYQYGDVALSVKHNVILPTDFEDVSVVWSSDNSSVIETDGTVHRPYDSSPIVTLTATISCNDFSMEKTFEVRVIKSMYDDYSIDNIYVMDEIEELYFYNDIIEDTYLYVNDDGMLTRVIGSICDITVDSPEEALLAIHGVKKLIGCESVFDELVIDHISKDDYCYYFVFYQVYDSVSVPGTITLITDLDGNIIGFINYYVPVTIGTDAAISLENAIGLISDCSEVIDSKQEIYIDEGVQKLVWKIEYLDSVGQCFRAIVDANNGAIISNYSIGNFSVWDTGEDVEGNEKGVPFYFNSQDEALFGDDDRHIYLYYYSADGMHYSVKYQNNSWDPVAVTAFWNVAAASDFYEGKPFKLSSFNKNDPNENIYVLIGWGDDNAEHCICNVDSGNNHALIFGNQKGISYGNMANIAAHEYTHGVVYALNKPLDDGYATKEVGAINEGYADVMAMVITKDDSWKFKDPDGSVLRDHTSPTSGKEHCTGYYDTVYKDYSTTDRRHENSLLLSHACYYMYSNGISWNTLSSLVYATLNMSYTEDSTFEDVRFNFEQAAKNLKLSDYQQSVIATAFQNERIYLKSDQKLYTPRNFNINGSVVSATPGTDGTLHTEALGGATVKIRRIGYMNDYASPVTTVNGSFSFSDIQYGKYEITVSKEGFRSAYKYIEVRNGSCLTLDVICLIGNMYGEGYGIASGEVIDSVSGNGVAGLTLILKDDMNAYGTGSAKPTNCVVAETVTGEGGTFSFEHIYSGQYTLEIVDNRPVASEAKYVSTFKNIVVFGNDTETRYTISVTNVLNAGSIRIVLEWYSNPRDLDSHLIFSDGPRMEIYYHYKQYYEDGKLCLSLDRDDVDGCGPETTTILNDVSDNYIFYVHRYAGNGTISTSGAKVSVYVGQAQYPKYIFYAPTDNTGDFWTVFSYNPDTQTISTINTISTDIIIP